jgi:hypothetical protein
MEKRGQITIFVILGIIIVLGGIIFVLINNGFFGDLFSKKTDYPSVVLEIQEHVDFSLEKVIEINSLQGGFYEVSGDYVFYIDGEDYLKIPVYFNKTDLSPSKQEILEQISLGVEDNFFNCVDFEKFQSQVNFDETNFDVESQFLDDKVLIDVDFPLSINYLETIYLIEDFSVETFTNYETLYNVSSEVNEIQDAFGDSLCLSCFDDLARKYNLVFENEETFLDEKYAIVYHISKYNKFKEVNETFSFVHLFENEN